MKKEVPEYAARLSALLKRIGMSQADFSRATALGSSNISYHLAGKKEPSAFACLLIAGLADSERERAYWTSMAGLTESQRALLVKAVGAAPETPRQQLIRIFLEFWENPESETFAGLRQVLRATVFSEIPREFSEDRPLVPKKS